MIFLLDISIVGCGGMAHGIHMPCVLEYGGANVISCADINGAAAKSLSEKYNIPLYFTDYNEMLEKTKPDAVVCLVSENAVAKAACDILQKCPVLLEKPPGKTVWETELISSASKKSGNFNMVAFNRRFAPVYVKLKELLAEDKSKIIYIDYKFHRVKRHENNFEDTAIHAIDTVRYLAGCDFRRVEIRYQKMPHLGEKVANYYIYFEFANKTSATSEILVSTGEIFEGCEIHAENAVYRAALPVNGEYGSIGYKNAEGKAYSVDKDTICPRPEQHLTHGFYNEHRHFYECLKQGKDPGNGADTASQSVAVCQAIKNRENTVIF
ncbi:MAG: Gfo/Idh/MocA family oxidoreductase [Oscillospiraceae bacterium]|nr:Gfo/Idh/MocA family oxidoreductase [Oscillospiraceae bacterium]